MPKRSDVCLLVMNCREIPECLLAFRRLNVDQVWLRGYRESELGGALDDYVRRTDYEYYALASDDLVPTQAAFDVVLGHLGEEPFTGWCNLSPSNSRANVRLSFPAISPAYFALTHQHRALKRFFEPLKLRTFPTPERLPQGRFRVFSTNFAFTAMTREMWLRFPLSCGSSGGSDFLLTKRLISARIPIWSHRAAFFYHLGSVENFITGKVKPQVLEFERQDEGEFNPRATRESIIVPAVRAKGPQSGIRTA